MKQLEGELEKAEFDERQASILNLIGSRMSEWGKQLSLEYSGAPLRIDLRRLNVVADLPTGLIPLDKMGGGENWVGYHLVAFAAMHSHFIEAKRPVPRFLMLDQPSQVYFPQDRPLHEPTGELDEDEVAVARMFQFLVDFAQKFGNEFQVIVMDHADLQDEKFQQAVVQRWRKGEALIPLDWINPPQSTSSSN